MLTDADAERRKSIFNGRDNARDCRNGPPLAGALHPDRIEWRLNFEMLDFNPRHLGSGRQKVLAVICRQRLPAPIIQHLLKQRVADAVNNAAANCPSTSIELIIFPQSWATT